MPALPIPRSAAVKLAGFYRRNGYERRLDERRREEQGAQDYKKGFEIRLVANSEGELDLIREQLLVAGFVPGRPFVKGRQFRQPLYGREQVGRFLAMVESVRR